MQPFSIQKKGRIQQINQLDLARKLYSMGVMPGIEIELIRKGPYGGTYYCLINKKQRIALRKNEAESIFVV